MYSDLNQISLLISPYFFDISSAAGKYYETYECSYYQINVPKIYKVLWISYHGFNTSVCVSLLFVCILCNNNTVWESIQSGFQSKHKGNAYRLLLSDTLLHIMIDVMESLPPRHGKMCFFGGVLVAGHWGSWVFASPALANRMTTRLGPGPWQWQHCAPSGFQHGTVGSAN